MWSRRWTGAPLSGARMSIGRLLIACTWIGVATCASSAALAQDAVAGSFRIAEPGYVYAFPRDHGAHPEFRTEWWYYTGQLRTDDEGAAARSEPLGFQLTFFRSGVDRREPPRSSAWALRDLYFAHLAIADPSGVLEARGARFYMDERMSRGALGMAGADTTTLNVWVGDWRAQRRPDGTHRLRATHEPDRIAGSASTSSGDRESTVPFGIDLDLQPVKPPVIHGDDGLSVKGAEHGAASHYVSLTRMDIDGHVVIDGRRLAVRGLAWMDQEFSTGGLDADQVGWDWFGLHLDDGSELMLYRMRLADGGAATTSSATWVDPDGRPTFLSAEEFTAEPAGETWRSPRSGAVYPLGWSIRIPGLDRSLRIEPAMNDCELDTSGSTGVVYWEGPVRVEVGTFGGAADDGAPRGADGALPAGRGYMELTGYAGPFRARL